MTKEDDNKICELARQRARDNSGEYYRILEALYEYDDYLSKHKGETMNEFIEVDSRKEALELLQSDELYFKENTGNMLKWQYETVPRIDKQFYKRNPDYQQFRKGQLVMVMSDNGWVLDIFQEYKYSTELRAHIYLCENSKSSHCRLPTEAELRELVPQVYEQFVKELEQLDKWGVPDEYEKGMKYLINKYKGATND